LIKAGSDTTLAIEFPDGDTQVIRRTTSRCVALLLAQGVDQRVVMEILGHSQISMTSRYAHVLPQVMTDAAERIGRALWGEP
jgi:integrase